MKKVILLLLMISIWPLLLVAQEINDSLPKGFTRFYHENGTVSSEGVIIDGKPDGYWKNYYATGVLRSEGNRVDHELDGEWKFYNENGDLTLVINYSKGLKNGYRITITDEEKIKEYFEDDIKQGLTKYYDSDGNLKRTVPFEDGREEGYAKFYDSDGVIITVMNYRRGVAISREFVNRYDHEGRPHGKWISFHDNGNIKEEYSYKFGELDGYYKKYDRNGQLISIEKYINGVLIEDTDELVVYEIRRDFYDDGQLKTEGRYRRGVPDGLRKEYNPDGTMRIAYDMDMGRIGGAGILDEQGNKKGLWRTFYPEGGLMTEGEYLNGIRNGEWIFYFPNGNIEQRGFYNQNGKEHGEWRWFYPNRSLRRIENFINGLRNGEMIEYSISGKIIARGNFLDDEEDGNWFYQEDGYRQEGYYVNGERDGEWKHYFPDNTLSFVGSFIDGYPDGRHIHYNPNGSVRLAGNYIMGIRHGVWRRYTEEGELMITVEYRNGIEIRYDNYLITPTLPDAEL